MNFLIRLLLLASLFFQSTARAQNLNPFYQEPKDMNDVRESVFRYMFLHYNYGASVKVFCIQPDRILFENFLLRFADIKLQVVWASECENSCPMNGVKYKKTGVNGLRMEIDSIKQIKPGSLEVKVMAFSDGIAANWNTLRVIFQKNRWVVESDHTDAVS